MVCQWVMEVELSAKGLLGHTGLGLGEENLMDLELGRENLNGLGLGKESRMGLGSANALAVEQFLIEWIKENLTTLE